MPRARRRLVIGAIWAASAIAAALLGWWAAHQATSPPGITVLQPQPITVEVTHGTVTVEQVYGIEAMWTTAPVGVNGYAGTLTSVALAREGSAVSPGDVLYTVDLEPVVALHGSVPAFRDMRQGTQGDDVSQLQRYLVEAGYLRGVPDGKYGAATAAAVDRWSGDLGVARSGGVPLGRVVFIPELPATLAPANDLRAGTRVMPGEELLVGAHAEPQFRFRVLPEAVSRTVPGLTVRIDANGQDWHAEVDRLATEADDLGTTFAILRPVGEAESICGSECDSVLTLGATAILPGTLVLVPPTEGAQVPTAAIMSTAAGATYVTLADGTERPVEVLASNDGRSIVSGVQPGDRVVLVGAPDEG